MPRTHNLGGLLDLIVPTLPAWEHWQPDFRIITEYAVGFRYPGPSRTADNTQHAMHICDVVRQAIQTQLELPTDAIES